MILGSDTTVFLQVGLSTLQNGSGCQHSQELAGSYYKPHFTDWESGPIDD